MKKIIMTLNYGRACSRSTKRTSSFGARLIAVFAAVLCCAMTTTVNAQNTVEEALKYVDQKTALADKNPTNGKMQYEAATACITDVLGEKKDYDRALTYANRALKIAQEHPAPQDTLKGLSYYALMMIYIGKQSWDNAIDFMELAVDAFQEELGRYDPVTNGTKLLYGYMMMGSNPFRGYPMIQEAFNDNEMAPQNKRIDNILQVGIVQELALEMLIAAHTKRFHHGVPRIYVDCQPYYIVQTGDWNIERPLVGWMVPHMLRSEAENEAYEGDPTIVCDEYYQFKVLSKEEKKKYAMNFSFKHFLKKPRHLEVEDCSAGIIFPAPDNYDKLLAKYREFKATMK